MTSIAIGTEAQRLIGRGWKVIRLEPGSKKPVERGWPEHDAAAEDFEPDENIGVKFGPRSGGLVDIDLDYAEARKLIGRPVFGLSHLVEFGRSSLPAGERGHRLVVCPDGPDRHRPLGIRGKVASAAMKARGLKLTVLEVRGSHGSQTAFPPSIAKGDPLIWTESGEQPPTLPWDELNHRVGVLALCALAAAVYPATERDEFCAQLSAVLIAAGVSTSDASDMVAEVAALAGDDSNAVLPPTAAPTGGLQQLFEHVGLPELEPPVRRWLRLDAPVEPVEPREPHDAGEQAAPGAFTADQLLRMLDALDPADFADYYSWRDIMFASHHATAGSAAAREVFVAWSGRNPDFASGKRTESGKLWADEVRAAWGRIGSDRTGSAITVATLLHHLVEAGHADLAAEFIQRPSASEEFDGEEADVDLGPETGPGMGLTFLRADHVEPKPLNPLWPGRMYIGKLTTLAGMPDQGKSVVTCDIAARVTRGDEWPDGSGRAPEGSVIILSAEDDPEDTIAPRLLAAGAVMERVYILNSLVVTKLAKRMFNIAEDLARLTAFVKVHPDVRALFIDPANAYMGTSKEHDSFRDSDVRAVLGPLKEWAEEHQIAVIIITHFKKGGTGRAIDQVMGSLAFTALSRSAWAFIEEKDADGKATGRKVMAKIKQNITEPVDALAYTLVGVEVAEGISAPRVQWGEVVAGNADDVMAAAKPRPAAALSMAVAFLRAQLADGPKPTREVNQAAREFPISEKTLARAKEELHVISEQTKAGWMWRLPETANG
jgi:hypothetical protein